MNEKLYEQLELSISKTRLDEYSKILKTQDKKIIFTYYILNSEISKSLYIPLQNLEIALRNSIHNTLTSYYKTSEWYEIEDFLLPNELKKISEAKNKIMRAKKELTADRVISELSFGFWTSLFSKAYDQKIWNKHTKQMFPNMLKKDRNRRVLSSKINTIRYFRNRIFHFEQIFDKQNLSEVHLNIFEIIKWLNLALFEITKELDEFNSVVKNEKDRILKILTQVSINV
jgi:hypothetical protein